MCAAHACLRSALTQAFCSSQRGARIAWSVPEFLAPALARPRVKRHFSSSRRRRDLSQDRLARTPGPSHHFDRSLHSPKPSKPRIRFGIPVPDPNVQHNIRSWLSALDPFLPPDLRQEPGAQSGDAKPADSTEWAGFIVAAQEASHDIFSHLGLRAQRWRTVDWLVRKLVEDSHRFLEPPLQLEHFANIIWPDPELSLQDITTGPIHAERVRPSQRLKQSLDDLTAAPDSIEYGTRVTKRALGQIWRSLGSMILTAAESPDATEPTMSHVLEIIAFLHHSGLIPDSIYKYRPYQDTFALQQPPTLHLLSSQILTALSDASWRAHETSVKVAKERMNAQYFLGHEIPGSRFKTNVTSLTPELWLELVLWSCLHGGWIVDGTIVLEQLQAHRGNPRWRLQSWREVLQSQEQQPSPASRSWPFFKRAAQSTLEEDRSLMQRTISSEIVAAFVDGLVNLMRVGVGTRGTPPEELLEHMIKLKRLLEENNLSLGSASWDSVSIRLLESSGIVPEKRPELMLTMSKLASNFGMEIGAANAPAVTAHADAEPPYYFDPSTVTLAMLHRAMRSFLDNGDISGTISTLQELQDYTDANKRRSLEQFFAQLKALPSGPRDEPFSSHVAPIDYPNFDNHLPLPLLARTLDLVTQAKMYKLGRFLLFNQEIDGPVISSDMYYDRRMSASIIRFGTLAREDGLVMEIVRRTGSFDAEKQSSRLSAEVLSALLTSQIQRHRWESVKGIQNYVLENPGYRPRSEILAHFAAELLRLSVNVNVFAKKQNEKARTTFKELLYAWEALVLTGLKNELNCVLAILSTTSQSWKDYCSEFLAFSTRQGILMSTDDFNIILSGVLDGYGSLKGKELVETWCYKPPKTFEPYRAPGGLPTMHRYRLTRAEEIEARPENIVITQPNDTELTIQGRFHPNRQTIFAIVRKVHEEVDEQRSKNGGFSVKELADVRATLKWAVKLLYYLGFDYEDIVRDLGTLAEMAQLESPKTKSMIGDEDEDEREDYGVEGTISEP